MVATGAPTLSQRELNRALLARQLLLDRGRMPVADALERVGGLQAQYAPAMYIGLWSRVEGFTRSDLTGALERREVTQGTLLRATIHLVSARDYWPFTMAIRRARLDWYLRVARGITAEDVRESTGRLRTALAKGPLRRAEIDKLIGADRRMGATLSLDLVRIPPSGTWERRRADLFALADEWLGPPPPGLTEDDSVDLLVRRYLGGFGPATRAEIADWAGLPVSAVTTALDRLGPRRLRSEDGANLVDLPDAPLPDAETPAPVRFLPVWDATLLVHARRARILPEEYRSLVFNTKTPHSVNTFLVDGAVAGTWRYEDGHIATTEFHPLPRSVRREVGDEAERLAALHA
ncbi:MAG TPA: winged helix DNA-binding domain-containing protein [Pilimelia sp.]|nr:winged helix DNA-binding domain-containing protein [Pilimelia sp.]